MSCQARIRRLKKAKDEANKHFQRTLPRSLFTPLRKPLQLVSVHRSGTGSFFGDDSAVFGKSFSPKKVPVPLVGRGLAHFSATIRLFLESRSRRGWSGTGSFFGDDSAVFGKSFSPKKVPVPLVFQWFSREQYWKSPCIVDKIALSV